MQKAALPTIEIYALTSEEVKPLVEFMKKEYGLENIQAIYCDRELIKVRVVKNEERKQNILD